MRTVHSAHCCGSIHQSSGAGGAVYAAVSPCWQVLSWAELEEPISVGLYAVLGLVGLPIFAEGGGIWYVLKPSFGYIIGFALGSLVTGLMVEKQKNLTMGRLLAANFTGLAIVYACGMIYYYIICNFVIGTPIAFWPLFLYCFLLAVPGDICLCFVGAFLAKRLRPAYQRIQS